MKAVFITYNQSITEKVQQILDKLAIRGYSKWTGITGCGSVNGEQHDGTHIWPEVNNAHITIVSDEKVPALLQKLKELDEEVEEQGLRAFVWNIENMV